MFEETFEEAPFAHGAMKENLQLPGNANRLLNMDFSGNQILQHEKADLELSGGVSRIRFGLSTKDRGASTERRAERAHSGRDGNTPGAIPFQRI